MVKAMKSTGDSHKKTINLAILYTDDTSFLHCSLLSSDMHWFHFLKDLFFNLFPLIF